MYFDSLTALWQMGVHGAFVWSAYGICLALIVVNVVWAVHRSRRVRRDIRALIRRQSLQEKQ